MIGRQRSCRMKKETMRRSFAAAVACLMLGASVIGAGQAQAPVFTAGTTYVSLDVVVTDADNRPIEDLRRDEFVVLDRGRQQSVADFEYVNIPIVRRTIDLEAALPPSVDVATNTISRTTSRALAIVVDDTRLSPSGIVLITRTLKALIETLAPEDQVAFTYVSRSDLSRDFTNDHLQLVRSVTNLRNALGLPPIGRQSSSSTADVPVGSGSAVQLTGLTTPPLYTVLRNVVNTLGSARQTRKAIILVNTAGCLPQHREFGDLCKDSIKAARQSGVPIYGLNPLGLQDAMSTQGAGAYDSPESRVGFEQDLADDSDSLKTLAAQTGGLGFVQANLQGAVDRVIGDNSSFYLLGFYPNPSDTDGKFHDVTVRVTRPGARVRAKAGYQADGGRKRVLPIVAEMTRQLGAGLPDPSLAMRAFVAPVAPGDRGTLSIVTAELSYPIPDGGFAGTFVDDWRMGVLALDADGRIKASFQRPLSFNARWKPNASGRFVLNETVDLPKGTVSVRVGVTSRLLGRTGTVHVPVDVPNFTKKELQLSPLVFGDLDEGLARVDAALGLDRLRGIVPFPPTTSRTFTRQQRVRVHARATWGTNQTRLRGEVEIVGEPSMPGAVKSPIAVTTDRHRQHRSFVDFTLPLSSLAPGTYVLRVTVALDNGERAIRAVPFNVRP